MDDSILEVVHSTAKGLHDAGVMDKYLQIWEEGREQSYEANVEKFKDMLAYKTLNEPQGMLLLCDIWSDSYPSFNVREDLSLLVEQVEESAVLSLSDQTFINVEELVQLWMVGKKAELVADHVAALPGVSDEQTKQVAEVREKGEMAKELASQQAMQVLHALKKEIARKISRILRLWESYPEHNVGTKRYALEYFIDFAYENDIEVWWLNWAKNKGLLKSEVTCSDQLDKERSSLQDKNQTEVSRMSALERHRTVISEAMSDLGISADQIMAASGRKDQAEIKSKIREVAINSPGVTASSFDNHWKALRKSRFD